MNQSNLNNEAFKRLDEHLAKLIYRLEKREERLSGLSNTYSNYRLAVFLTGLLVSFTLFFIHLVILALAAATIFIISLGIIAHFHAKLDNGRKKLKVWKEIKITHLARLNLEWGKIPKVTYGENDLQTPNEIDLNITGDESLLQLINTTTSKQSSDLLRSWLSGLSPSLSGILIRQNLVKELIPLCGFRDKLILNSKYASKRDFDGSRVSILLAKRNDLSKSFKIIFAFLTMLAPVNLILFLLYQESLIPGYWMVSVIIYIGLYYYGNRKEEGLADEAEYFSDELGKLYAVFDFLERYKYKANSGLFNLCRPFLVYNERPSYLINKLKSAAEMLKIRTGNPFVWNLIRVIYPVDFYYNIKLKKYKAVISGRLNIWLDAWYNLEALSSLANFAFLNPGYVFPEVQDSNDRTEIQFSGKNIGHPLIRKDKKVRNDFLFNPKGEIAVITGSNMSGKSTFLRSLGINLSLAYAGSVVDAETLRVSLFRTVTCIKVSDSVVDGISYFYAEVRRLKFLLDEAQKENSIPAFFLIDEIFRGTNNVERLKGSLAFIKSLSQTSAAGAVATHDLELVNLAEKISKVRNYHFKEEVKEGKMIFNYKINPGPCPTTNALKIMQIEGLPVE